MVVRKKARQCVKYVKTNEFPVCSNAWKSPINYNNDSQSVHKELWLNKLHVLLEFAIDMHVHGALAFQSNVLHFLM